MLLAGPVCAQHPIDKACANCITKAESDPYFMGEPGPARSCEATALRKWNAEMVRLLAKMPSERLSQTAWARQRDKHVMDMKRDFMKSADIASEADLPMTLFDEIRWYQISITRKRVLALAKISRE